MRATVLDNDYFKVGHDAERKIVFVTRRSHEYTSTAEIHSANKELLDLLNGFDRSSTRLLMDVRLSGIRNDPEFVKAHQSYRNAHIIGFKAIVFLVGTEEGRVQVARILKENGIAALTAKSETEALAALLAVK